jgi:PleD family two-component response regulator
VRTRPTVLYFSPADRPVPSHIAEWIDEKQFTLVPHKDRRAVESIAMRNPPILVVVDADGSVDEGLQLCRDLKADAYTAVVPVTFVASEHPNAQVGAWFEAGADEVITPVFELPEQRSRLDGLLLRTERNVSVHPSTRLPGTIEIDRAMRDRIERSETFAVCYADLDHFKEYNDRYSYRDGDRVIFLLSRILSDVAKGLRPRDGFVGHIGGDDFIMVLPIESVQEICSQIVSVFDTLIPYQYNEQDRRAGYFFGRDRRGQLYRVPLMTLSIGIVTNEHRRFGHPARASELATEMKSYAKTLPGSVFVVDRRHDRDEPKHKS